MLDSRGGEVSLADVLAHAQPGDQATITRLLPLVYGELRALAASYLEQKPGHTLQPTALVHEAYMKLVGAEAGGKAWSGRDHFVATAAIAMRQVLVDHARRKLAAKRGGADAGMGGGGTRRRVDLDIAIAAGAGGGGGGGEALTSREMHVLELDELLTHLAKADERAAKIAEMHLFGGMTQEQIARVLGVSRATVVTDWSFARAWLASKAGKGA